MSTVSDDVLPAAPTACRLCGSASIVPRGAKRGRFRPHVFHFYECVECTFLFVAPVMGPEIYDDSYYRGEGADPLVDYESEYVDYALTPRIDEFRDLYRLASKHLDPTVAPAGRLRWLDFGCGAGGMLKFLRDKQTVQMGDRDLLIVASGCDVGSYADKLQRVDGLKIWTFGELEKLPAGSFEVISCIEVIEHIAEPVPVFELLGRLLTPGGVLLLSTGNLGSPLAKSLGIRFPYCIPEIHVSYFNPRSLATAYANAGLRPLKVRYDDALRFKVRKNIGDRLPPRLTGTLARFVPLLRALDVVYGVSAMPSATKDRT